MTLERMNAFRIKSKQVFVFGVLFLKKKTPREIQRTYIASLENYLKQKQFRELNEAEIMRHLILMGSTFIFSTVENMAAIWRRFMAITFKFSLASKKFTQLH